MNEEEALQKADEIAKEHGYGNVIAFLKRKWADRLKDKWGASEKDAVKATDVSAYPPQDD